MKSLKELLAIRVKKTEALLKEPKKEVISKKVENLQTRQDKTG